MYSDLSVPIIRVTMVHIVTNITVPFAKVCSFHKITKSSHRLLD